MAKVTDVTKGSLPVTVTKPVYYWIRETATSTAWALKPGTNNVLIWHSNCNIIVKDRWWVPLGPAWTGAHVQEKVKNPGEGAFGDLIGLHQALLPQQWSPLGDAGNVTDVVRGILDGITADVAADILAGRLLYPKSWVDQGVPGMTDPMVYQWFYLKFFVDEIELTGTTKRSRSIHNNRETVTSAIQP